MVGAAPIAEWSKHYAHMLAVSYKKVFACVKVANDLE